MKHCKYCGAKIDTNDAFCGKCGANQTGGGNAKRLEGSLSNNRNERSENRPSRARRSEWIPALRTEAGRAKFTEIETRHAKRRSTCFAVLGLCALGGVGSLAASFPIFGGLCVVIAFITIFMLMGSHMSEGDYYTIPGSRDDNGKHRCIHCGHVGIYRKGEYKTNNTHAQCSSCATHLWTN